jgi:hypothetical protein
MSWTLDPRYVPANVKWAKKAPTHLGDTIAALQGRPRDVSTIKARPTTLSERLASAIVPDGRKWTDLRNKVSGAVDALTPLGAEQPLRDARSAYQGGNKWGAAGLGALAMLGAVPGVGTEAKAGTKAAKGIFGKRGIIAYHGSPHSFDRFSLDKIGTGEGAQAYGHGLYFAENEDVARSYRDALRADHGFSYNGKTGLTRDQVNEMVAAEYGNQYVDNVITPRGISDGVMDTIIHGQIGVGRKRSPEYDALKEELSAKITNSHPGSMYQVRINANPEDFLDWDKPLRDQPQAMKALNELDLSGMPQGGRARTMLEWAKQGTEQEHNLANGSHLANAARGWGEANPAGTEFLRGQGIPGIKYLDQGSRGAGDGSRNYVVFDDALIEILKKYGIAVPAMGLGIAGMSQQPEGGM